MTITAGKIFVAGTAVGAAVNTAVAVFNDHPTRLGPDEEPPPILMAPIWAGGITGGAMLCAVAKTLLTPVDGPSAGQYGLKPLGAVMAALGGVAVGGFAVAGVDAVVSD